MLTLLRLTACALAWSASGLLDLPVSASAQAPAAPAEPAKPAAPAATLGLYGTLNVNLQVTGQDGVSSRTAISTDVSNIGVRGALTLYEWLKAEAQCETSANVDGISVSGICNRNSRVALASKWATLWYGNWDTPLRAGAYGTKAEDPFLNTDVFGFQSILSSPGFNYRSSAWKTATDTAIAGFDVRASNSVGLWTAKYYGLSAKFQYSTNEFESANGVLSPALYGAVLNFDAGPFSAFASYELHEDGFGLAAVNGGTTRAFSSTAANVTTVSSEDWAWRVGAGYQLDTVAGATTLLGAVEQLKLGQDSAPAGALREFKRVAWQVGLKHRFGDHELRARYSRAHDGECSLVGGGACSTDGYGAYMIALGYAYHLAKSVQVYVHGTRIWNDINAQYTFTVGGSPAVAGATTRGSDPKALGFGIRYAF